MNRRKILKIVGATVVIAGGALAWRAFDQEIFSAGSGAAYEPWKIWQAHDSLWPLRLVRAPILAANPHNSQALLPFRIGYPTVKARPSPRRALNSGLM